MDINFKKLTLDQLKQFKSDLIEKRESLKKELKTKHAAAYKWLIEHNIDLDNLHKYSKNIATMLSLSNQLIISNPSLPPIPTPPTNKDDLENATLPQSIPSPEELAKKVWREYGDLIKQVAKKYDLDPQVIFATIMTESEGNPKAYRFEQHINDASFGLGQILYNTAKGLGFNGTSEDMYRPEINIDLIGKYHRYTLDTYGQLSPEQMAVVYNTGQLNAIPYRGYLVRFVDWYYNYLEQTNIS